MKKQAKINFLNICKWLGFFKLARHLTRHGLRILYYHNFSQTDEVDWRPSMFITPVTLKKRLDYLKKNKFPVLSLGEALELFGQGTHPSCTTVITIDDGWYPTKLFAHPLLRERSFPYTVYVTSYPSIKVIPVFNHAIDYVLWKTELREIDLSVLNPRLDGKRDLMDKAMRKMVSNELVKFGRHKLDEAERGIFVRKVAGVFGVSYSSIEKKRILSHLTADEIKDLVGDGVDIQLHTHTHFWREDDTDARNEVEENRAFLEPLVGKQLEHFCYPSGIWRKRQFPLLESLNIKSATTTISGLNFSRNHPLALKRYVDNERKSEIEFEAEVCGFIDILSRLRRRS